MEGSITYGTDVIIEKRQEDMLLLGCSFDKVETKLAILKRKL